MFNVCPRCGQYRPDKIIEPAGPYAICPVCGHRHPFRRLPLFLIGGASGTGKTTAGLSLPTLAPDVVALESDILWVPHFDRPDTHYRDFMETWLRMAKNIGQSGRPVAILGAGFAVPENVEPCIERRYFSATHYLALVCDEDALAARLVARPRWRSSAAAAFVESQRAFNRALIARAAQAAQQLTLLDTTHSSPGETTEQIAGWIHGIFAEESLL